MKLARELAKRATGRTLYILDEPTTGLHFHDVEQLLHVLHRLRDEGNTIVVIEHNLDVIKTADWVIDLGPEGGESGGEIIATGTPEDIAASERSWTGKFLAPLLTRERLPPLSAPELAAAPRALRTPAPENRRHSNGSPRRAVALDFAPQDTQHLRDGPPAHDDRIPEQHLPQLRLAGRGGGRRIGEALRAAGLEVWFDQSELRGGDAWDQLIRRRIRECRLFVPIISAHTQTRLEGYFRLEWRLAVERSHLMADGKAFLVPVAIDSVDERQAEVPEAFRAVQWTQLPGGVATPAFITRVAHLLALRACGRPTGPGAAPPASAPAPPPLAAPVIATPAPPWPRRAVPIGLAVAALAAAAFFLAAPRPPGAARRGRIADAAVGPGTRRHRRRSARAPGAFGGGAAVHQHERGSARRLLLRWPLGGTPQHARGRAGTEGGGAHLLVLLQGQGRGGR